MSLHGRSLHRLKQLFGLLEHASATQLTAATAALTEVEHAGAVLASERAELSVAAAAALRTGDPVEWALAGVAQEKADVLWNRLEAIRVQKEVARAASQEQYRASRIRLDQMELAAEWADARQEELTTRQTRSEESERFASRQDWLKQQSRRQEGAGG